MAGLAANTAFATITPQNGLGDIDWQNLRDNWRELDADWLLYRSIVRVGSDTPTATANNLLESHQGRVFYSTASNRLIVTTSTPASATTSGTSKAVLASDTATGLDVADSGSAVTFGIRGQSTNNISFARTTPYGITVTTGTVTNLTSTTATIATLNNTTLTVSGALTVNTSLSSRAGGASGTFVTNSTGVVINTTGSNASTLTTSATGLTVSTGLTATSFTTSGNLTAGSLTVSGAFSPSSLSTGAITSTGINNTGNITTSGSLSSGAITSGAISATGSVSATTSITAGTSVTAASYKSPGELVLEAPGSNNTLRVQSSTSGIVNMFHGSGSSVRNAWVVYGASPPGASTVPDGTLWIT